ncbi:MAG TPA: phosphatase PAP2-related protein [Anaeromyxobacter sp.]
METPAAVEPSRRESGLAGALAAWRAILGALAFRGACYAAMTAAAVWNELRPAPTLPDLVLAHVPYVGWVANANYLLWLAVYVPLSLALLLGSARTFVRYTISAGIVSLLRGATLLATGLGAPDPARAGPGLGGRDPLEAFLALLSPWQVFAKDAMAAYLTKDLFFSGHTATTFLLLLYLWPRPRLRWAALAGHVLVVLSVFLSHLHYAIDVLGAYAVALAVFAIREGWPRGAGAGVVRSGP